MLRILAGLQGFPVGAGRLTGGLGVPSGPFLVAGGCGGVTCLARVFDRIWGLKRLARALVALGLVLAVVASAFRCVSIGAPALLGVALLGIVGGVCFLALRCLLGCSVLPIERFLDCGVGLPCCSLGPGRFLVLGKAWIFEGGGAVAVAVP